MVKEQPPKKGPGKRTTGPRGGTTTVTEAGLLRKNLWITHEQNEGLRLLAFRTRRSEADLIRQGIDLVLALADQAEEAPAGAAGRDGADEEES